MYLNERRQLPKLHNIELLAFLLHKVSPWFTNARHGQPVATQISFPNDYRHFLRHFGGWIIVEFTQIYRIKLISIKWHLFYKHTDKYHTLVGRNYWLWNDSVVDCPQSPSIEWHIHRTFIVPMCLQLHISQGCFCHHTVFENTGLNLLLWNFIVSFLYPHVGYSAGVLQDLRLNVFGTVN